MKTKKEITELLHALPVGEVVTDRSTLYLFKRLGFIADYSWFSYIESTSFYYLSSFSDEPRREHSHLPCPKGKGTKENPATCSDFDGRGSIDWPEFEFDGMTFRTKYLDGCFCPYLYKAKDPQATTEVNRRMSLWGAIL